MGGKCSWIREKEGMVKDLSICRLKSMVKAGGTTYSWGKQITRVEISKPCPTSSHPLLEKAFCLVQILIGLLRKLKLKDWIMVVFHWRNKLFWTGIPPVLNAIPFKSGYYSLDRWTGVLQNLGTDLRFTSTRSIYFSSLNLNYPATYSWVVPPLFNILYYWHKSWLINCICYVCLCVYLMTYFENIYDYIYLQIYVSLVFSFLLLSFWF